LAPVQPPVPQATSDETGWVSSGGGGVACFGNEEDAAAAEKLAAEGRDLGELKSRIRRLVTLDYWDFNGELTFEPAGKSAEALLEEVGALFELHTPIFHERYQLLKNNVRYETWEAKSALPLITDRTPRKPLTDPKCRLVQLAVRHSRSTPGSFPELRLEVDEELSEKLDPLNLAMLILHERLYVLGKLTPIQHPTSDDIRFVVTYLFSKEIRTAIAKETKPSWAALPVQRVLNRMFGDYYEFFLNDPYNQLASPPPGITPYSRSQSFGTLVTKMRNRKARCMEEGHYLEKSPEERRDLGEACLAEAVEDLDLQSTFTEEEAFLFLSYWTFGAQGTVNNPENLAVWNREKPAEVSLRQEGDLMRACLQVVQANRIFVPNVYAKALTYCERLGLWKPVFKKLHCTPGENEDTGEILLERNDAGTYDLSVVTSKSRFEKKGIYCFKTLERAMNLTCTEGGFDLVMLAIDRGEGIRIEALWSPHDERLRFSGGSPSAQKLGACKFTP
jgi:hypothetical protein